MSANFDRVARIYRWAEYLSLGPLLQRTRTQFLSRLLETRQALVLGDGDGRFLSVLLERNQHLRATAVDSSERMLQLLRERTRESADRLETVHADALNYFPHAQPDLIVSHFFLDCFPQAQVDALVASIAASAAPAALWVVSDFRIPRNAMRPIARAYVRALYFAFRMLTGLRTTHLADPARALQAAGFRCVARHERLAGLLYTEVWQSLDNPSA